MSQTAIKLSIYFLNTYVNTLLLYGNAFAYIQRDGAGIPICFKLVLHPDDVQVKQKKGGRLVYEVRAARDVRCK